jgi:hypothetical protein
MDVKLRGEMMSVLAMRFVMGLLFLILGIMIFARHWWMPELDNKYDSLRMNLGAVLALVFGGLNLARWYAAWTFQKSTQTPVRYPLRPDPSATPQDEPIPEFDFTRQVEREKVEGDQQPEV